MPSIQFSVPHNFDQDEVVSRLKHFLAKVREHQDAKFALKSEQWEGRQLKCAFTSYGFSMDAEMNVEPKALRFNLQIPFAALMFKGQIEQKLRDELTKLLA
jgi:hypothetical protein